MSRPEQRVLGVERWGSGYQRLLWVGYLVARWLAVNVAWLIACIPLVTIPPATLGLYLVVRTWVNGNPISFRIVRQEGWRLLLRSYGVAIPMAMLAMALYLQWRFYLHPTRVPWHTLMLGMLAVVTVAYLSFAVQAIHIAADVGVPLIRSLQETAEALLTPTGLRYSLSLIGVWLGIAVACIIAPGSLIIGAVPFGLLLTEVLARRTRMRVFQADSLEYRNELRRS